jgi:hypothetical protein
VIDLPAFRRRVIPALLDRDGRGSPADDDDRIIRIAVPGER